MHKHVILGNSNQSCQSFTNKNLGENSLPISPSPTELLVLDKISFSSSGLKIFSNNSTRKKDDQLTNN